MRTAFAKGFNKIFNRLTITVAIIIVQCVYLAILFFQLTQYASWIEVGFRVLSVFVAVYIIWRDYNPAYKIGWIVLIAVLPAMGAVLYLLFGNKRPSRSLKRRLYPLEKLHREDLKQEENIRMTGIDERLQRTVEYVAEKGPYPAWLHTATRYYEVGDKLFDDMLEDLKKAEHYIFLEYFIIERGRLWDQIFAILKEKAAEGLDVRVIYDDIGSINKLPRHFAHELTASGIRVQAFNPMRPFVSLVYNNRDHRKICVIDGYIGYNGGANIADEYANIIVRFGHWKDSGVRLCGEAVWNYTVMFLNMWNAFRPEDVEYDLFRPHVWHPEEFPSDGIVQPFSDTPLDDENLGENVYMEIVNQARDYVFIYTPYLVPDNEMITALTLAAKRGVDVRLVTPGIPDKKMIYDLTRSHYKTLLEAGVRIYEYTPGFIHAKSFVSDDRIACVGTINIDYRSLYLHFECGTLLIDNSSIMDLRSDAITTFGRSHEITLDNMKTHFFRMLVAALLRVISPVL
ncbi:cardiolipin synthase [Hornefia porci]|uniref:Cardiolipin synthase n=1 Tax=Hornefia porci TaxID=2652292 RepID=A0A1Q9JJK7_9FIRM|nr:cardiolipin synthase [Hornefia porci]OLR56376.1 cardiolipin synthase [Hornefia porci]